MSNDRLAWPILLILLTVLVPSLGVVWMMREAVSNERLAASQRLREAYQVQLESVVKNVEQDWSERLAEISKLASKGSPSYAFKEIVEKKFCDSVLIRDQEGVLLYPDENPRVNESPNDSDPRWYRAQRFEYVDKNYRAARQVYAEISRDHEEVLQRVTAQLAVVRCLLKLNERDEAAIVLKSIRQQENAFDRQGRSLAAVSELRLLQILNRESASWKEIAKKLEQRLGNYRTVSMPSSQRRFLMAELQALTDEPIYWPTQAAEKLAAEVAETLGASPGGSRSLSKTNLPEIWSQTSQDKRLVLLMSEETIRRELATFAKGQSLPEGVEFVVTSAKEPDQALVSMPIGQRLGPWRVSLVATEGDLFERNSQQQKAFHAWIALIVIGTTCVLGWLLAATIRRRLQLAQLKNDLVATVSHELKTPLAAIRLLVDTLLEAEDQPDRSTGDTRTREYLELISKENSRLTRLIENFLTFSRMERNKQRFDFQPIDLSEATRKSAEVFEEHIGELSSPLTLRLAGPLMVSADFDALVTVVVNLLENAWKYSEDDKEIVLATSTDGSNAVVAVRDHGIGLSARDQRRIFDRFYQVDQKVSRTREGCGLGLSIVHAIVEAHGGEVSVESQLGEGSTFE
ncbi:MAG: HAMP domain-containing sensor histidine kinase, partial [Lacipirellulaceae bacterium]